MILIANIYLTLRVLWCVAWIALCIYSCVNRKDGEGEAVASIVVGALVTIVDFVLLVIAARLLIF